MLNKLDPHAEALEGLLAKPEFGGEGRPLKDAAAWLAAHGVTQASGRPVTAGQVHAWWSPRRARLEERKELRVFLKDARDDAQATVSMPGVQGDLFLQAGLVKIGALVMKLADAGNMDAETVGQVKDLWQSLVAGVREKRSGEALAFDREKFAALQARADRDRQTETVVTDAQLTPEQRAQRIKEIYGRA